MRRNQMKCIDSIDKTIIDRVFSVKVNCTTVTNRNIPVPTILEIYDGGYESSDYEYLLHRNLQGELILTRISWRHVTFVAENLELFEEFDNYGEAFSTAQALVEI